VLFFVGLIIAIIRLVREDSPPGLWGVTSISVVQISAADWTVGLFQGAIPQVPTTLLNSCIAVCKLAEDLYPHRETGCNVRSVSVSVGLLNVVLCWFGALPICHGSGGLAGQHRFGARTNLSVLVLGALKLVLGLFFAPALLVTLRYFPTSILAAMLAISAFELASAARSALTQVCFFFYTHVYAILVHTHTHTHTTTHTCYRTRTKCGCVCSRAASPSSVALPSDFCSVLLPRRSWGSRPSSSAQRSLWRKRAHAGTCSEKYSVW
jgi:hypothetical protein